MVYNYSLLCHYSFVYALKHNGMRTDWVPCANAIVVIAGVEESLVDETNACWECVERGHPTQSVFNTRYIHIIIVQCLNAYHTREKQLF